MFIRILMWQCLQYLNIDVLRTPVLATPVPQAETVGEPKGESKPYKAAGCFFTDGRLFLAGYQPHKSRPRISGIGGGRNPGESVVRTALRETLEELFDLKTVTGFMITEILGAIHTDRIVESGSYHMVVLTFNDLEIIMGVLAKLNITSPLFNTFPRSMAELLFERKIDAASEISHLALLPCVKGIVVCPALVRDIAEVDLAAQGLSRDTSSVADISTLLR